MALRSVCFGVRSRKLSNVGQSLDGCPKIYWRVKPLIPAVFALVCALGPRGGLWPVLLMSNP
jgi:hypothetical protein